MFAPSMAIPRFGRRPMPRISRKVVVVLAEVGLLTVFAVAGTVFFGLTIASPVAVPAAHRQGIVLSASDLATAQHLGSMWWLFAAGAILSFGAALVTIGNVMRNLGAPTGK